MKKSRTVSYDERSFTVSGERVFLTSGSIHYFRVPNELWRDRLEKARCFGLNCIQTYVAWNFHEPREGEYVFSGDADLDAFLSLCEELELYVIVRPGPYICAEWDFGGFPGWLLKKEGILIRRYDPVYLNYVDRWFDRLVPIISDHQYTRGGRVILVQAENELSNIQLDAEEADAYLKHVENLLRRNGIEVPMIACAGSAEGLVECINSHTPADQTTELRSRQPECPLFSTEFWPGWYSTWHNPADWDPQPSRKMEYETWRFLASGACGYNYYMWHGGTNFGYTTMYLQTTSYDFTAPLSEAGGLTSKYRALARPARFAQSFSRELAASDVTHAEQIIWENGDFICRLRRCGNSIFLFLENCGGRKRKMDVPLPAFGGHSIAVEAKQIRTAISNVDIGSGFLVERCTLPVLGVFHWKNATVLILEDLDGRLRLKVPDNVTVSGDLDEAYDKGNCEIEGRLGKRGDLSRTDFRHKSGHLILLLVSPALDNRVWPLDQSIVVGAHFARPGGKKTEVHFTRNEDSAFVVTRDNTTIVKSKKTSTRLPKIKNWQYAPGFIEILPECEEGGWLDSYRPVKRDLVDSHHGYAWYRCIVKEESSIEREIAFSSLADRAVVFVNGRHEYTTSEPPEDRRVQPSATFKVRMRKGDNIIAVLSDNLGHVKGDWQIGDPAKDGLKMHDDHKGLLGPVYVDGKEIHFWRFRDGLQGERNGRPAGRGTWNRLRSDLKAPLRWFKGEFELSAEELKRAVRAPLRIRVEGLTKGILWVNDRNLGRYWNVNGYVDYYVPTPYLKRQNVVVVFEEGKGIPNKVRLVRDEKATSNSVVEV